MVSSPSSALKLNFNGSACGKPGLTGLGGVISDMEGTISFLLRPSWFRSSSKAELLALRTGIREASKLNPQLLLIEGDSYCVIQQASQSSNRPWNLAFSGVKIYLFTTLKDRPIRKQISSPKREFLKLP